MSEIEKYIPNKGDIIWINFDHSSGQEIQKRRPGLVVSRYDFNRKTHFTVICPITSTIKTSPLDTHFQLKWILMDRSSFLN